VVELWTAAELQRPASSRQPRARRRLEQLRPGARGSACGRQRDLLGAGWSQAVSGASYGGRAGMSRERCGSRVEEQRRPDPSPAKIPTALRSRRRGCPAAHDCSTWCGSPAPKCTTTTATRCCCRRPSLPPISSSAALPLLHRRPFPHIPHLDGWLEWCASAWARRHVCASRPNGTTPDLASPQPNTTIASSLASPGAAEKGKSDLEVALPALYRPQCGQSDQRSGSTRGVLLASSGC
jgi:hypothetical protein